MNKNVQSKYFIFIFLFLLSITLVSACGPGDWGSCDYFIDDLDAVCLNNDNDTYVLNWSYFNWSIYDDIGYQRLSTNSTHRIHFQYDMTPQNDYAYVDADYIYGTIPFYSTFPKYTTYAEITVISDTTNDSYYPDEMGYLEIQRKTDESELWSGSPAETDHHKFYYNLSNSCGDKYPTSPPWDVDDSGGELLPNTVIYYPLNGSSGDVIDCAGNKNGTNVGATRGGAGKVGNDFSFDGGDYVTIDDTTINFSDAPFSINMWVYPDSAIDYYDGFIGGGSGAGAGCWAFYMDNEGDLVFGKRGGVEHRTSNASNRLTADAWNMVTVIYQTDDTLDFYIDGDHVEIAASFSEVFSCGVDYVVGGGSGELFEGDIDEVSVYNITINETQIDYLYNSGSGRGYSGVCGGSGGGGGGSPDNITVIQNFTDENMTFLDRVSYNLSTYFQHWYELALIFDEPIEDNESIIITGYGTAHGDYFEAYLGAVGEYNNLTIDSYQKNHTVWLDVFGCDNQSDIDNFCPTAGFPSTCNISAFYTDEHCANTSFMLGIYGGYTPNVTRNNNFSLFENIGCTDVEYFEGNYYYQDYDYLNITYEYNGSTTRSIGCYYTNVSDNSWVDEIRARLQCLGYNIYVSFTGLGNLDNYTVTFNASNSVSYLTDTVYLVSANETCSTANFTIPVNYSHFYEVFTWNSDETVNNWIMFFILLAVSTFFVLFVCIPLRFSPISLYISFFSVLAVILFFAIDSRIGWSWFIVPTVLFLIYKILKFFSNG